MLWGKESVEVGDLYRAMQRGKAFGDRVLSEMILKLMIEKCEGDSEFRLAPGLRRDIEDIFKEDQPMIPGLWGQ
jgi:hypothetical protein